MSLGSWAFQREEFKWGTVVDQGVKSLIRERTIYSLEREEAEQDNSGLNFVRHGT